MEEKSHPPTYSAAFDLHPYAQRPRGVLQLPSPSSNAFRSGTLSTVADFGSPCALRPDWAPTEADAELTQLPSLDWASRVQNRLSKSQPLDFTAPCFRRRPGLHSYRRFPSRQVEGKGKLVGEGFKSCYFGPDFVEHDVSAADWARFLEDVEVAGRVGIGGQVLATVAPVTMHMDATGYFVTKAIKSAMAKRKEPEVLETIEAWSEHFFLPRNLEVFVHNGRERLTARRLATAEIPPLHPHFQSIEHSVTHSDLGADEGVEENKKTHNKQGKAKEKAKIFLVIVAL